MTIWQRIRQMMIAIVMIVLGVLLMIWDQKAYPVIIALYSLSLTVMGIRILWFYFRMARYMVGGGNILCRGILTLDFGVFAGSLVSLPSVYILLYLTGSMAFAGIVDLLRARESKGIQGAWKLKTVQGLVETGAALICLIFMRRQDLVVDIFAVGFIFSAVMRMVNAFRPAPVITID